MLTERILRIQILKWVGIIYIPQLLNDCIN